MSRAKDVPPCTALAPLTHLYGPFEPVKSGLTVMTPLLSTLMVQRTRSCSLHPSLQGEQQTPERSPSSRHLAAEAEASGCPLSFSKAALDSDLQAHAFFLFLEQNPSQVMCALRRSCSREAGPYWVGTRPWCMSGGPGELSPGGTPCGNSFYPGQPQAGLLWPHDLSQDLPFPQLALIFCKRQRGQVMPTAHISASPRPLASQQVCLALSRRGKHWSLHKLLQTYLPWGPKSAMMYIVCTGVLMTWLLLMNSSEGSQVTMRDFKALPSLPREPQETIASHHEAVTPRHP